MLFEEMYMNELEDLLLNGSRGYNARTGQGVIRKPHVRFQVDLSKELPVLKSKKLYTKSATDEILWIMQKQSNKREDISSGIWDKWVNSEGTIGKAYGYQVYPEIDPNKKIKVSPRTRYYYPYKPTVTSETVLESIEFTVKDFKDRVFASFELEEPTGIFADSSLFELAIAFWKDMMVECYVDNPESRLSVNSEWQSIERFVQQFKYIEGFKRAVNNGLNYSSYTLSTSYYNTNCYSLDTVVLATHDEDKEWSYTLSDTKMVRPMLEINQVSEVIRGIFTDPSSRRLMINLWNIQDLKDMELEPCCFNSDFTVIDGKLNCCVSQRSADVMVGVPFNMYQYAILTLALASATYLEPGILTLNMADFHVYDDQKENAWLQISRWKCLSSCEKDLKSVSPSAKNSLLQSYCDDLAKTGVSITTTELRDIIESKPAIFPTYGKCFYDLSLEDLTPYDYKSLPAIKFNVAK
jgi:thymidylate synthase